jgi:hypothetical protein
MDPIVEATITGSYIIGSFGLAGVATHLAVAYWLKKRLIVWDEKRKERKAFRDELSTYNFSNLG